MFSIELELISVVWNPKSGNQVLSIRIRGRYIFNVSSHCIKNVFLLKWHVFNGIRGYLCRVEPEGGKSSALYQNPGSIHFKRFLNKI